MDRARMMFLILLLGFTVSSQSLGAFEITDSRQEREITTCKGEATAFWVLRKFARFTPFKRISKMPGGEKITFETSDGVRLRGIKLNALGEAKGFLLIIQGNGFPAGRAIQDFGRIRELGLDVYEFDFRGYKRSGGKSRFWAMLNDYAEILADLSSRYENRFVYATSFGGVITANVIREFEKFNLVILDAVVSRASSIFECDRNYDPIDKLPKSCQSLHVQVGSQDRFYQNGNVQELMDLAVSCGGTSNVNDGLGHPWESDRLTERLTRMEAIEELVRKEL